MGNSDWEDLIKDRTRSAAEKERDAAESQQRWAVANKATSLEAVRSEYSRLVAAIKSAHVELARARVRDVRETWTGDHLELHANGEVLKVDLTQTESHWELVLDIAGLREVVAWSPNLGGLKLNHGHADVPHDYAQRVLYRFIERALPKAK